MDYCVLAISFFSYLTLASARANVSVFKVANSQVAAPSVTTNSLPLTTNASFSAGLFPYIIPYNQPQQCDIFGPICQTGLITVGVSLASGTTTTALPCSSYLTSQADYLLSARLESGGNIIGQQALEWLTAFGRSPECKSYAGFHRNEERYTFSDCGSLNTVIQASEGFSLPTQIPPGVVDQFRPLGYSCCGNCTLIVPEVRLFYFPDPTTPRCESRLSNSSSILSTRAINKRAQSLNNTGSIAVLSGHTFTSPSVYLQVVGTAAIRDECGSFGPILTNPIITLPPNVLSTYVPPSYYIGSTYTDLNALNGPSGFVGRAEPLNIADLECPTFGLGIKTSADGNLYTTVGPPWLPIIIPPREVFTLDPMWASVCTDLASYYVFESFAIFDPPFALAPKSYLVAPSPAAPSPNSKGPPRVLASPTAAYDPPATYLPDTSDPTSSQAESKAPPANNSPAPQQPPANAAQPAAVPLDPSAKPTIAPDPPNKHTSEPQEADGTRPEPQNLGSFISSAFGKGGPQPGAEDVTPPIQTTPVPESGVEGKAVGGQILSISPSGVYLSGTSYSPGGPAITLSSGVFSLVATFPAKDATTPEDPEDDPPRNNQPFAPSVQTIAGHIVVSNTSGVYVAGSSLSAGGDPVTASKTVISLSPVGTLVIGSSSISLSIANTPQNTPTNLNFDGISLQAGSSATVFDGITLIPGGPGTIRSENSISLEQGGTVDINTAHFALPALQTPEPNAFILQGMTVQQVSSAVLVDGTTLTPGGAGVFIHGTRLSLGDEGILDVGTSHFALPTVTPDISSTSLTLDGMTIQQGPSAVLVDGITLKPGGPGTFIHANTVSLGEDGTLDIGTSHFALPSTAQEISFSSLGLDGYAVQAAQSAVVVDGVTLSLGGPGTIIHGSSISLEQDGTLDIGTSHFALPTVAISSDSLTSDGMAVQATQSDVVVDGVTLSPGGPGKIAYGSGISLEQDGTLNAGSGRFAISTDPANGTAIAKAFEGVGDRMYGLSRLALCAAMLAMGLPIIAS